MDELVQIVRSEQKNNRVVVHCHGVFDLLHIGHIRYFNQAKRHGDILIVTLTPDRYVDKGPSRPAFTENLRAEAIASLNDVDFVAVNEWLTAVDTLRLLRPDVYAKGDEFQGINTDPTGKMATEANVVREIGSKLVFTTDIVFSSSNLINRYLANFTNEQRDYLHLFRERHPLPEILEVLDKMSQLRVLVIGDVILDEYQYCQAIGKSSKDPILALHYHSHEIYAGGVLAVANHIAGFAGQVDLVAAIGENDPHESLIRQELRPNVHAKLITRTNAPTTLKRRFVDANSLQKIIEIYVMDDNPLTASQNETLSQYITQNLNDWDIIVVSDFGHGLISQDLIHTLCDTEAYLAVNTQANAGNRGFNTIGKYPRTNFFSLAEHELRLETRDQSSPLRLQLQAVTKQKQANTAVVTQGHKGCVVMGANEDFVKTPSFACKVVDKVGAGDALFAVAAMAARLEASPEVVGFLGSMAGSLAVKVIGNQRSVEKLALTKAITAFMK